MAVCGKHRGIVTNNIDPLNVGRLQVEVPDVPEASGFAMPCVPYAGPGVGLVAVPPIGANVWVEFEAGDPSKPIWTGCFWGSGEAPPEAGQPGKKIFKTEGVSLIMDDAGLGGFTLEVGPPATAVPMKLVIKGTSIEIINTVQNIKLTPSTTSVNDGVLVVI